MPFLRVQKSDGKATAALKIGPLERQVGVILADPDTSQEDKDELVADAIEARFGTDADTVVVYADEAAFDAVQFVTPPGQPRPQSEIDRDARLAAVRPKIANGTASLPEMLAYIKDRDRL